MILAVDKPCLPKDAERESGREAFGEDLAVSGRIPWPASIARQLFPSHGEHVVRRAGCWFVGRGE